MMEENSREGRVGDDPDQTIIQAVEPAIEHGDFDRVLSARFGTQTLKTVPVPEGPGGIVRVFFASVKRDLELSAQTDGSLLRSGLVRPVPDRPTAEAFAEDEQSDSLQSTRAR